MGTPPDVGLGWAHRIVGAGSAASTILASAPLDAKRTTETRALKKTIEI
jgi:hypothetical protein